MKALSYVFLFLLFFLFATSVFLFFGETRKTKTFSWDAKFFLPLNIKINTSRYIYKKSISLSCLFTIAEIMFNHVDLFMLTEVCSRGHHRFYDRQPYRNL